MDWCVKELKDANHNPIAAFNGDLSRTIVRLSAQPAQSIALDASASQDPDGDALSFRWCVYPEAGTYAGPVEIEHPDGKTARVAIPADAAGKQIHVILEVRDDNPIVARYAYRRLVIDVKP
jgi:hypothetical protein